MKTTILIIVFFAFVFPIQSAPAWWFAPLVYGDIQSGSMEPGSSAMYNRSIVMDSGGWLYAVWRDTEPTEKRVCISRSTDGGVTWDSEWQEVTDTSAYGRDELINGCSMAIDEFNNLYVVWHRYEYSPAHHSAYFRKCTDTRSSPTWTEIKRLYNGSVKGTDSGVAIDSDGFVWVLTGGPSSWKATVWKSDSAYASDLNFTSVGCPSTGSCQGVTMCIDKDNNVHCSYYDNSSSTGYAVHRYYNGSSWEMRDDMGDGSTGGRDHNCGMAADDLGNVHILYANNAGDVTGIWYFKYRKWDSVSGISDPVDLCSFPTSLYSDVCNRYISNICCNESTGDAFVIIRDLNEGGSLCLYRKTLTDTAFTLIEEITADTMGVHYYYEPRMRGTLFPAFNNTSITIDISWTEDRSGSSHEPFYRYTLSEGPYLMSTFPPPNLWVSVDTAIVLVFLDPDGIDPSTARIAVNGISYTTFDHELTCSGDSVIFQPSSPWPEDTITVELIGIDDALGHASPDSGLTYSFFIDKSPPVITYREPDSALVMDYIPSGTMIKYKDFGCGTDSLRWVLTVAGEDFSAPSGGGLIIEGDTTVMLAFSIAGIVISDGDTVDMEFTIRDNPDIGAPNLRNYYWWFTASTGIEERKFPLESCLSIYPNPFNRACRIYSANPVKIYDISGHLVWRSDEMKKDCPASSQGHEYIWIPDESLQSGVFLVKMQIDGKYLAKKVIYLK